MEALFAVLASSQATSLSELADNWKRNPAKAAEGREAQCPRCAATCQPGDSFCTKCGQRLG